MPGELRQSPRALHGVTPRAGAAKPGRHVKPSGTDVQQVLGRLADLPVGVGERGVQLSLDLIALERGKCENRAPADGGLVGAGCEHDGQRRRIPCAPSAATAASRTSGSGWVGAARANAEIADAVGAGCSPIAYAPASATQASESCRSSTRRVDAAARPRRGATSAARRRTRGSSSPTARRQTGALTRRGAVRTSAASATARTRGSGSSVARPPRTPGSETTAVAAARAVGSSGTSTARDVTDTNPRSVFALFRPLPIAARAGCRFNSRRPIRAAGPQPIESSSRNASGSVSWTGRHRPCRAASRLNRRGSRRPS